MKETPYDSLKEIIDERYSCRLYLPAPVAPEMIDRLVEAARMAPSATNRQPWHFIAVGPDDADGRRAIFEAYPREWVLTAPRHIVVCKFPDQAWVRPADGHNHCDIDIAIATEHICLAATALGLASCWICNFDPEKLADALPLPQGAVPAVILPIGYPAPANQRRPTSRKPLDEILTRR